MLEAGHTVTMIGRHESIGATLPYPPATVEAARERLMSGAFDFVGGHHLQGITADEVIIGVPFTERIRTVEAHTVVLVSYPAPNRELATALTNHGRGVHLIGDVNGTNGIMPAIHQAATLTRTI